MKVVILAGGFGTRLSEYTDMIPKPMVEIGSKPILWRLMQSFGAQGFEDFSLALGYKAEVIKDYFLRYYSLNSDAKIDLSTGKVKSFINERKLNWKIDLVDTGLDTMTGGRLKRMQPFLDNETFILTYGDGLASVDINALLDFHKSHGKMVTVTAVRPLARFGELKIEDGDCEVSKFSEKPQTSQSWINGGYFVINPEFFEFIADDTTVLEKEPLEHVASMGELMAYKHTGFWQCMDSKRDRDALDSMVKDGSYPWILE
jgi:glucose-1-phosphate cytidylyltransferase